MTVPRIDSLWIWDIANRRDVRELVPYETLNLSTLPAQFTIRAAATNAGSVVFDYWLEGHDSTMHTENIEPFNAMGDTTPIMQETGRHFLSVQPYAGTRATGQAGFQMRTDHVVVNAHPSGLVRGVNYFEELGIARLLDLAREFGFTGVRGWRTVTKTAPQPGDWEPYKIYYDAGVIPFLTCTPRPGSKLEELPTALQVRDWFNRAADFMGDRKCVWGGVNEFNLSAYYPMPAGFGTGCSDLMERFVKPMWEALHPRGLTVASPSANESHNPLAQLVPLGLLGCCDLIDFHPYGGTPDIQKAKVTAAYGWIANRKPLVISEWNLHGKESGMDYAQWAAALQPTLDGIRSMVSGYYYFQAVKNNSDAGQAGLLLSANEKNQPFYDAVKGLR